MAIISRHLAGSLRFVDDDGDAIHSYHRIRPNIQGPQVEDFLQGVTLLRGETGGNAFLTLTTELLDDSD